MHNGIILQNFNGFTIIVTNCYSISSTKKTALPFKENIIELYDGDKNGKGFCNNSRI